MRIPTVAFLVLIVSAAIPACFPKSNPEQDKVDKTSIALYDTEKALDRYRAKFGKYPSVEDGLKTLVESKILAEVPREGWGREIQYVLNNERSYTISSLGADGKPGGEGFDRDLQLVN